MKEKLVNLVVKAFTNMMYKCIYKTPDDFGDIIMESDGEYLKKLVFWNSKDLVNKDSKFKNLELFAITKKWLDIYFKGDIPDFTPKYKLYNLSNFTMDVIEYIKQIPYGKTISYKDIADSIAKKRNIEKMSSQAVGGAVGRNPICIIIPCHRVIGSKKKLVGFGGGLHNKISLLKKEGYNEYKK